VTEAEAWDSLAEHLKQKNYTGVLVLADWFQENGKEVVAVYLRWANNKKYLPEFARVRINGNPEPSVGWSYRWDISKGAHLSFHDLHTLQKYVTERSLELYYAQDWYND
jgi:hypothetical protein